ncbi:MAG: hypothetical protein COT25_00160 [Candidatus Kerfeldbacteria bacterium CG08_land_8_20_14_0_20_42_7]|uniref:Uncharacterized protein n=1 Tax=Candidatus Kerfeldbacteria bacterium CG08_land_8_20_14_0_20_42_7 TaxID=2014245 RepID=A0A2H0YU09_9BACT|nr:MAG: hypothetical protein COT25_00160 [Candidatus Kerfeldbacteria bacterium CG08_land_8_20_14_0_20_42_7]
MSPNLYPIQERFPQPEQPIEKSPKPEQRDQAIIERRPEIEKQPEAAPQSNLETDYGRATAPVPVQRDDSPQPLGGVKSEELIAIENILSEHLDSLYASLPDNQKPLFREKGEETAQKIDTLLKQAKVKVKQILELIITWLSIVPGINKFFIEQQAEIKMNKLIALHNKQRRV